MAAVVACTRPARDQASKYSSAEMHEQPYLVEMLTVNDFWGKKSQFFSRMWPLVGSWNPSEWPHTHEYMGSTSWTWLSQNKEKRAQSWEHDGGESGRS